MKKFYQALVLLLILCTDDSIADNIEKLTRVTAAAASCPLGPAHAVIKMRTHHPLQPSTSWRDKPVSGHERSSSSCFQLPAAAAAPVYSPAAQPRVTAARHGQMLPGRGGAGRGHQGEGRTVTISSALRWTGHRPALAALPLAARGLLAPYFPGPLVTRDWGGQQIVTSWPVSRVTCHAVPILARPHTDCFAWLLCGRLGLRTLDTAAAQMSPAPSRTLM